MTFNASKLPGVHSLSDPRYLTARSARIVSNQVVLYLRKKHKSSLGKIIYDLSYNFQIIPTQHYNVAWTATLATFLTFPLSSPVSREAMTHSWKN